MSISRPRKTVHIIDAHLTYPNWSEGSLSRAVIDVARGHLQSRGYAVTLTRVEAGYEPAAEVQRHLDADLVMLQTPVNWFGAPWIYKKYVDEVFNEGLHTTKFMVNDGRTRTDPARQYGTGGRMHGRGFFVSSTWNAPTSVFSNPDSVMLEGRTVDDLLLNLTSSYRFVGFTVMNSFGIYDIFHSSALEQRIAAVCDHLDQQLVALDRLAPGVQPGAALRLAARDGVRARGGKVEWTQAKKLGSSATNAQDRHARTWPRTRTWR